MNNRMTCSRVTPEIMRHKWDMFPGNYRVNAKLGGSGNQTPCGESSATCIVAVVQRYVIRLYTHLKRFIPGLKNVSRYPS